CPCGSTLMETFDDLRAELHAYASPRNGLPPGTDGASRAPAGQATPGQPIDEELGIGFTEMFTAEPVCWNDAWYEGLRPSGGDAFPKRCPSCDRVYETPEDFFQETAPTGTDRTGLKQAVDESEGVFVEAFRNCVCGSTLMDSFSDRRDMSAAGNARREKFSELLVYLVEKGIDAGTAREELLEVIRGGKSELLSGIRPPGAQARTTSSMPGAGKPVNRSPGGCGVVRVLFVDARDAVAATLGDRLAQQADIELIRCVDPDDAPITAAYVGPTVIIVVLPASADAGLALVGALRAVDGCRDVPIVVLSSGGAAATRKAAFLAGASDFLDGEPDALEMISRLRYHSGACMAHRELRSVTDELEKAQGQLFQSEKMASVGMLAAGVAHEINNPIAFITSNLNSLNNYHRDVFGMLDAYAEIEQRVSDTGLVTVDSLKQAVRLDDLRKDVRQILDECRDGLTRVRKILENLKSFSRKGESDWQQADLHEELERALTLATNEIKYKADVVRNYGDLPQVRCIPSRIGQVFLNLLVNAAHAIEGRGRITITTSVTAAPPDLEAGAAGEGEWVRVDVSDTGCGIDAATAARIFEPFFTTKDVGKGTGLGLSVSHGIIRDHGGRIGVESEPGRGTTFSIRLPAGRRDGPAGS
ncbi:MAG: ATP-binding protein, partial [Proteobacteria bacterium]|nr:ATP-binding protein [Pseudomonadota bacterium]